MGAALAGERDSRRGAGEHEPRARVGRVDDSFQGPHHERVVEGADREQPLALEVPAEAELPEQQHQVHLGDPHLDVLASGADAPFQGGVVHRVVDGLLVRAPDARLVDEAAQVGGRGDVGSNRDEPLADSRDTGEVEQGPPKCRLRRGGCGVALRQRRGHGYESGRVAVAAVEAATCLGEQAPLSSIGRVAVPLGVHGQSRLGAQPVDLFGVEEGGVVLGASGHLEAVALDRVGEDHGGPVGRLAGQPERIEDVGEVVPTEVAHERRHPARVAAEQPLQRGTLLIVAAVEDGRAHDLLGCAEERLVLLVGHRVDPAAQQVAALTGVRLAQAPAVLELDHVPAVRAELRLELRRPDPGDHPVERLPVEVDDPQHIPEPTRQRIRERLPDVALVELRITQQRDEPTTGRGTEPRLREPVRKRTEQRRRRTETDRPRGIVDRIGVLRPRRIRLQTPEITQTRQIGTIQPAEQILDRLQHRRGMRLHRHPVLRPQIGQIQRRHQRHHRRRRRLMTTHLRRVTLRPLPIRVIHDPHCEPQHPSLDALECDDVQIELMEEDDERVPLAGPRRWAGAL